MRTAIKLDSVLEQGENVMWSGTPQSYSLFGESYIKSTIITVCVALAVGIFLVGGYYTLSVSRNIEIKTGVMIFCAAVPFFIIGMALSDKKKVKKLLYAVTNKRAIVLSEEPIFMHIGDIDDVRTDKADDGNCHIRVGSPTFKTSARKLPILAYNGKFAEQDSTKICKGLTFFNVRAEDEKVIRNLLKPAPAAKA